MSTSLSLSLPPFLDLFEMDSVWPIARFWEGAWGEPGAGWDLLLPERREVITERIVGASLETFPSRLSGVIDEGVKVVASNVKQPRSPTCVTNLPGWSPYVTHRTGHAFAHWAPYDDF